MRNHKLKVCHVASADMTVALLLMPQLKFLIGEGYDVYAVCSPGKLTAQIEKEGIKVKTIEIKRNISPTKDVVSLWQLFWYFKKEKFDMVHTHAPKSGLLGQLAAKMAGVPIIINTVHGLYVTENSSYLKKTFFTAMDRIAAKCSTLIFSQNKEDIDTMVRKKIAPAGKITYLSNGIDIKKFNSDRFPESFVLEKKKSLHINSDAKIIGMVGRLVKEKGYLELFEAFATVLKKFPNTLLLVIGPEEPNKKDGFTREIAKNYGIENSTIFLGERTDMVQLYPLMDIFVLPSWREGFPRSVLEAMAEERPIIATNIRGCREEIENGKEGVLVPIKNPKKLAEAAVFFLENPKKAKEMASRAKIRAIKEFDENLVFNRIKEAYSNLLLKNNGN